MASQTRTGRKIQAPVYSSGSEDNPTRQLRKANMDTAFLFVDGDEYFTLKVESKCWPRGVTLDEKLSLVPNSLVRIFRKEAEVDVKFLMKGSSESMSRERKRLTKLNLVRSGPSSATKMRSNSQCDSDFSEDDYDSQAGPQSTLVKKSDEKRRCSSQVSAEDPSASAAPPKIPLLMQPEEPSASAAPPAIPLLMQPLTDEIAEEDPCMLQEGTACGGEEFKCFLDGHEKRVLKAKEASEKFKKCADKKKKKIITDFEEKVN